MQYTLHLTNACNFSCHYCRLKQNPETMRCDTAYKAVDLALSDRQNTVGIGFYGGEPLLCKPQIRDIIEYTKTKILGTEKKIFFKLTTNGALLDDEFLAYADAKGVLISLSIDGTEEAHNLNRKDKSKNGTYENVSTIIPLLLAKNRYASALMTVTPNTVQYYYDSVCHIFSLGFVSLIVSLDYSAAWTENDLIELKKQYIKLAVFYYKSTLSEKKFYFSPFDSKINSHIENRAYCRERCQLGYEQISISPDGGLYPCIQFAGDKAYQIGHVNTGIDEQRRKEIFKESRAEQTECIRCAMKNRCLHTCACVNRYSTGGLAQPSPVLCANERMLIPIADGVAEKLYKKRNGMFIHKHYNEFYSLVSLVEDAEISK